MVWWMRPFTQGYQRAPEDEDGDGFFGSMLLFFVLTGIVLGICLSHWCSVDSGDLDKFVSNYHVHAMLVLIMIAAIIAMVTLCMYRQRTFVYIQDRQFVWSLELGARFGPSMKSFVRNVRDLFVETPDRFALVMLWVGSIVLRVMIIIPTGHCLSVYALCHCMDKYAFALFYYILRLLYITALMIFCCWFRKYTVKRCLKARYLLALITSSTFVIASDSAYHSSNNMPFDNDKRENVCVDGFNSTRILSHTQIDCLYEIGPQHNQTRLYSHYLYPLQVQFLVMIVKNLLVLYFGAEILARPDNRGPPPENNGQNGNEDQQIQGDRVGNGENIVDVIQGNRCSTKVIRHASSWPCLILGIIIFNGILLATCIASDYFHESRPTSFKYFILIFMVVFLGIYIIILVVAFYVADKLKPERRDYNGFEMAILICGCSCIVLMMLILMAQIIDSEGRANIKFAMNSVDYYPIFIIAFTLVSIIILFFQTAFMMQASRIDIQDREEEAQAKKIFYASTLNLALMNHIIWWQNGLLRIFFHLPPSPIEPEVYGTKHWNTLYHSLHPLVQFYLFNSGFVFFSIFLKQFGTLRLPQRHVNDQGAPLIAGDDQA